MVINKYLHLIGCLSYCNSLSHDASNIFSILANCCIDVLTGYIFHWFLFYSERWICFDYRWMNLFPTTFSLGPYCIFAKATGLADQPVLYFTYSVFIWLENKNSEHEQDQGSMVKERSIARVTLEGHCVLLQNSPRMKMLKNSK